MSIYTIYVTAITRLRNAALELRGRPRLGFAIESEASLVTRVRPRPDMSIDSIDAREQRIRIRIHQRCSWSKDGRPAYPLYAGDVVEFRVTGARMIHTVELAAIQGEKNG